MASNSNHSNKRRNDNTVNGRKKRRAAMQRDEYKNKSRKKKKELTKEQIKNRRKRRKQSVKKYRKKYWTTGKKIVMALCIMILLLVLAAIGVLASKMSLIQTGTLDPSKLSISDIWDTDEKGYLNVALFGVDTREMDESLGTRSDTMIIASLNLETKEVKLTSLYRDTLLMQEDDTFNKANAAYSFGGVEESIAMMNRNLDLDIQHYVTVDFSALVHVIDALGGIEIEVTEEEVEHLNGYIMEIIENTGVDTWAVEEAGYQNLTGVQATAYARIRYTTGDDFKRTERQRTVLLKIAEKLQNADLATLNTIIDKVFPMVETNFSMSEILYYAKDIAKYQIGETNGFPFDLDTRSYGNVGDSVFALTLESNVRKLHGFLFPDLEYTPSYQVQEIDSELGYIYGSGYYAYDEEYSDTDEESYNDSYGYSEESRGSDSYEYSDEDSSGNSYNNSETEDDYYSETGTEDYSEEFY